MRKIAELEEENALLRLDLAKTIATRNEYIVDADHGTTEISELRGEIMTLLAKMGIEKPQRPIQENEVFLDNTPFVIVLIDGSASMVRLRLEQQSIWLTRVNSWTSTTYNKERGEVGKQCRNSTITSCDI